MRLIHHVAARSAVTALAASAFIVMGGTAAVAGDPPGNNGVIKIEDEAIDTIPQNDPHQGCTFNVEFYGYDEGVGNAQVAFELRAPTKGATLAVSGGDLTPAIGEDPAGGGNDLDARETITLRLTGASHPIQGFHVKVTVRAAGSIGNDTKTKVFWVEGCRTTPSTTSTTTEPPTSTTTTTTEPPTSTTSTTTEPPTSTSTTTAPPPVATGTTAPPSGPTGDLPSIVQTDGVSGPVGSSPLAWLAGLATMAGAALYGATRKARQH